MATQFPDSAHVVADIVGLLAGASRTTRIHVLSLTPFVPTSVRTDLVLGPVLLLAGDGLLMVVHGVRFALFGLRVLSTLGLTSLDGMPALLMRACPLLALRSSLAIGLSFGSHLTPSRLHLAAIAADLFRSVVYTVRDGLRIGPLRVAKRVLILGGTVANPLLRTGAIGWADIEAPLSDCPIVDWTEAGAAWSLPVRVRVAAKAALRARSDR